LRIIFDLNYFNKKSLVTPENNNRFSFSINEKLSEVITPEGNVIFTGEIE
tara:strand:+ start:659 stop:808 length:150 start_codon:yes stop_codon:yes gene_type:complete